VSSESVRSRQEIIDELIKLKEAIERTLLDIREFMNNLENPFNYIALVTKDAKPKGIEIDKEKASSIESSSKASSGKDVSEISRKIEKPRSKKTLKAHSIRDIDEDELLEKLVKNTLTFTKHEEYEKSSDLSFINALLNIYIMIKYYGISEDRVETTLNILHNYGLISRRTFRIYMAALELLSEIIDVRNSGIEEFIKLLSSIMKVNGNEVMAKLLMLILSLYKSYEVEVI